MTYVFQREVGVRTTLRATTRGWTWTRAQMAAARYNTHRCICLQNLISFILVRYFSQTLQLRKIWSWYQMLNNPCITTKNEKHGTPELIKVSLKLSIASAASIWATSKKKIYVTVCFYLPPKNLLNLIGILQCTPLRPPRVPSDKAGYLPGEYKEAGPLGNDYDDDDLDPITRPDWNVGEVRIVKLSTTPFWAMARSTNVTPQIVLTVMMLGLSNCHINVMDSGWAQYKGCILRMRYRTGKAHGLRMGTLLKYLHRSSCFFCQHGLVSLSWSVFMVSFLGLTS